MSDTERGAGDDELSLPKATTQKLIQEFLPRDITCPKETRDLIVECCVEFIHLVSSEANEICEKDSKKTIAAEHVVAALNALDFDSYVGEVSALYEEHKLSVKHERARRRSTRAEGSGMTQEQLLELQEALTAKAREQMKRSMPTP